MITVFGLNVRRTRQRKRRWDREFESGLLQRRVCTDLLGRNRALDEMAPSQALWRTRDRISDTDKSPAFVVIARVTELLNGLMH